MSNSKDILATIPVICEDIYPIQLHIPPDETAEHLCRRVGVHPPSHLCKWPLRVRVLPEENVHELLRQGASLYIHERNYPVLVNRPDWPAPPKPV